MDLRLLLAGPSRADLAAAIAESLAAGSVLALAAEQEERSLAAALAVAQAAPSAADLAASGPAVILGSGGSSGGRRWCLQPQSHLQASAAASGQWLQGQGLDPSTTVLVNPLPLHHISGLMPLVRSWCWGVPHHVLPPALLRDPGALAEAVAVPEQRPAVLSLVPTQLERLLQAEAGLAWLARFALIWVGGAGLDPAVAARARSAGLRLSPCYGATETAAMVCALPPAAFLRGEHSCGAALADVTLRLAPEDGAVEVATDRLALGWLGAGGLEPLALQPGRWWRSGDGGRLDDRGALTIHGRLDGAIHSGGVTVFPDQLSLRLQAEARQAGWPLAAVLLLPRLDPPWGERLVALVRPQAEGDGQALVRALTELVRHWPAAERPRHWLLCPELDTGAAGKWERARWQAWVDRRLPLSRPSGGQG